MTNPMCCNVEMRRSEITKGSPLWCKKCGRYGESPASDASDKFPKISLIGTKDGRLLGAGLAEGVNNSIAQSNRLKGRSQVISTAQSRRRTAIEMMIAESESDNAYRLTQHTHYRVFKPTDILIWGANTKTTLEAMTIGTEAQFIGGGLPALLFASPFNVDTDINELSPAKFDGLADLQFSTAHTGQILTLKIRGKVSRVVLLGIELID